MLKRTLFCLLACLSVESLRAQIPGLTPGPATVGVPYSFDFANFISPFLSQAPPGFFYSFTSAGGTLPPGLTLSNSVVSGTPTESGNYTFSIDFAFGATVDGMTVSFGPFPFPASIDVTGNSGSAVTVDPHDPSSLTFSFPQGSTSAATQSIVISNKGNSATSFTASATVNSGSNWLSVSPGSGAVPPVSTRSVTVSVNPTGLGAGTYLGTVSIAVPEIPPFNIAVTLTVSSGAAQLELSQTGFRFQTVAGGGNPPSQTLSILNSGSKSSNFGVSASTISGGQWLTVAPATGTISASSPAVATINIDASGLAAGDYYGQIQVSAGGALNSPQTASVVLNVAKAGTDLGAFVSPTGVIFVGQAGGAAPAAQTISVTNPSTSPLTFSAGTYFAQTTPWFTVQPDTASVSAANPATISVQPVAGLSAGIYAGDIQLHFTDDTTSTIAVLAIVTPASPASAAHAVHAASACTPTKLLPVFTQLGADFSTVAAWPTPVEVTVVDDCGNFLTAGSVTASFSDGDPPLPLTSLNNGSWSATWQPRNSSAQVVITVDALEAALGAAPPLQGTQNIGGTLQSNPTTPSINSGGVVSAAQHTGNPPLAPGGLTSIYGVNLGAGQNLALSLPLTTQLGATQVVLGGRQLPLQYAGNGQVNAVIPYDVPPNTTQQLIISNGPALSVPEPVVIAPAQPAVFAQSDGSGVVFDVKPGATAQILVDKDHPMSAGDAIVIYCAGLGPVTPNVQAGTAAPSSPPATTINPAIVTIGGKSAQVFFNGLVGGFAGLYQVNAYVPKGITPGNDVPLVISVAGFESAAVTVAVK